MSYYSSSRPSSLDHSAPAHPDSDSSCDHRRLTRKETARPTASALAKRIHGWTWQAFPIGMGTGAVYVTLSGLQQQSRALIIVQTVFYFLNMAIFILNSSALAIQAIAYPRRSWALIKDPIKGIFVPLIVLSFATIVIGTIHYAVPTGHVHSELIYDLFWIYVGAAVVISFPMLMIWFNQGHDLTQFTPAYAFLIFPMMLVGVVAFNVLNTMEPSDERAVGVLFVGYFFQGIGMFMTFFYLCIFIIRVMTTGFLEGHQANGAFVVCGPPGFSALALLNLGARAREILPAHNLVSPLAGEIWFAASVLTSLMLFGLAVFFFFFGLLPYWFKLHKNLNEILGCWALTFPNVGWISTLRVLGEVLSIPGLYTLHLIMTALMILTWAVLFVLTVVAFHRGLILMSPDEEVAKDSVAIVVVLPLQGRDVEKGAAAGAQA
ncbi:voltage-dependent anion channel-domain-containing protein [Pterulicium gracile]|uniref:Voltage-dependent anion channel-domain-containing protein n=1 Tax=Pterulicium gracile TaxID=1884261 RepID=A0A5C3Q4Q5_9AGAR|nr:voltage-dependent anion channel-domain-containing protein [Pterula gracilis]